MVVNNFMQQGPDLSFLSAFPHEKEALYPPLTFFKPRGNPEQLTYNGTRFTIVDVKATFPSYPVEANTRSAAEHCFANNDDVKCVFCVCDSCEGSAVAWI